APSCSCCCRRRSCTTAPRRMPPPTSCAAACARCSRSTRRCRSRGEMAPAATTGLARAADCSADVPQRNRGFALLLVIWVLALLAVLAAAVAADSHSEALIARHRIDLAEARGIADAGIVLAVTGLFSPDPAARWPVDGTARCADYGGGTVAVRVIDE